MMAMQLTQQECEYFSSPVNPDEIANVPIEESHQEAEQSIYEQLLVMLSGTVLSFRSDDRLKFTTSLVEEISDKFTHQSGGEQEDLDQIILSSGFEQVSVNAACFTSMTTHVLASYIPTAVQDQAHHEYLLVFFQPTSDSGGEAYYHFFVLSIFDSGISIIMPSLKQQEYITISVTEGHINTILLTICSQLYAEEIYAYHRVPIFPVPPSKSHSKKTAQQ